jgi:hypothetical protein
MADKEFTDEELEAAFEPVTDEELEAAFEPVEQPSQSTPMPQMEKELTRSERTKQGLGAFGRGLMYGGTMGIAPAAEAAGETIADIVRTGSLTPPGSPEFRQKVLESSQKYKRAKKQYPGEFGVGEAAGTLIGGGALSSGAARVGEFVAQGAGRAKGISKLIGEAGAEAGIGGLSAVGMGEDFTTGAGIGAGATIAGAGLGRVLKAGQDLAGAVAGPAKLKEEAIESVPTQYQGLVSEAAESPEALKKLQSSGAAVKGLKGEVSDLSQQLKTKQSKEESQFEQARKAVEEANKIKQADYDAALKEEDIAQKQMMRQTIEEVKNARSAEAANRLAESVNRGLNAQKQKAVAKYDIAFNQMIDQVQPKSSQILKMRKTFKKVDPELNLYAVETNKSLRNSMKNLKQDALTGAWTQGKEFKSMVEMDQAIGADLRRLKKLQNRESSPNVQRAIDQLETVKMQLDSRLNSAELGLEGDVLDQYNEAKAHYADFAKMRDELFEAKLLAPKRSISGVKKYEATAESASKFLQPKVEDTERMAKVQDVMQRLPGDLEDSSALTPAQFAQLRQQSTGPVPPLLPERTRPEMPKPELAEVPTQRAVTPEEQELQSQITQKEAQIAEQRPMAEAYSEMRPLEYERTGIPGWGAIRPQSPLEKIERAQFIERQSPGLARTVDLVLKLNTSITDDFIRQLAKQYLIDPENIKEYIETKKGEQQNP